MELYKTIEDMGDININNLLLYIIEMECGAIGTTEITDRDNLLCNNEISNRIFSVF